MKDLRTEGLLREVARNLSGQGGQTRRLYHGRGQGFPGLEWLNIDYYPPVLVLQVFKPDKGTWIDSLCSHLEELIARVTGVPLIRDILIQNRHLHQSNWKILKGGDPKEGLAWEDGLRYKVRFMKNQNVGFFPDMRQGRRFVRGISQGKKVLNLFSYTCSLSVAALAGGATRVVNLDISKPALGVGKQNHIINDLDPRNVSFLPFDVMKSFGRLKREGPFDLIIIDPPSFQKPSFIAEKDYPKLVKRIPDFLGHQGAVIACLNAPHLTMAFLDNLFGQNFQLCQTMTSPKEFREADPARGLKIAHYRHYQEK